MGELNLEANSDGIVSLFTGDVKDEAARGRRGDNNHNIEYILEGLNTSRLVLLFSRLFPNESPQENIAKHTRYRDVVS